MQAGFSGRQAIACVGKLSHAQRLRRNNRHHPGVPSTMNHPLRLIAVPALLLIVACFATAQTKAYVLNSGSDDSVEDVSLVQLIANPQQFHGKHVRFIGFLRLEFEGNAIYLHREDFDYAITRDALWIDVPSAMTKAQKDAANMHYVICVGVFNAKSRGHMGLFAGEIQQVSRLQLWAERPRPEHSETPPAPKQK